MCHSEHLALAVEDASSNECSLDITSRVPTLKGAERDAQDFGSLFSGVIDAVPTDLGGHVEFLNFPTDLADLLVKIGVATLLLSHTHSVLLSVAKVGRVKMKSRVLPRVLPDK